MNKIYQAKFTGIIELSEPLEKDTDYKIGLEECCVRRIDTKELAEDDNERITYCLENLGRVNILKGKEVIKAKAKKCTQSQVLRLMIENKGLNYEQTMIKVIEKWETLL
jgi:hypothetical protein